VKFDASKLTPVKKLSDIKIGGAYVAWCKHCKEFHEARALKFERHEFCSRRVACKWISVHASACPSANGFSACEFALMKKRGTEKLFHAAGGES
jgi:hypothetical protein